MEALWSMVGRSGKVFVRDRTSVFFSLLSVLIVIALYALFLQKVQVDAIQQVADASPQIVTMVNEWLSAGLLSMIAVTTTLAAFGIAIKDIESKVTADFLTAPVSRASIQLGYVINAFVIGTVFTLVGFLGCEVFIVATGGNWLSLASLVKVVGILLLSVLLASVFNMCLVLLVNTQNAFSTLSTIVGTLLGFLCGVYVPIGSLPSFAQYTIMYFPISHTTLLLRDAFMERSVDKVFAGAPAEEVQNYMEMFGISYKMHGHTIGQPVSYLIIAATIVGLALISMAVYKRKHA